MKYTVIDRTDIRVSRISFGTASLHHIASSSKRQKILRVASSMGITHFDTSPYYGFGLAELELGALLSGARSAFTVATKVGLYPRGNDSGGIAQVWARKLIGKLYPALSRPVIDWSVSRAEESLRESLERLRTDYIDFVFLHEPDARLLQADEFLAWFEREKARGRIRSWGVAGSESHVVPLLQARRSLTNVVQTADSLEGQQANFVLDCGRGLQFTYGYFSSECRAGGIMDPDLTMRSALKRNVSGSIVVSTRRTERLVELARCVS
jgi:aryl-alcohol dehydrogenase-like predicted oxidoreductase